MRAAHAAQKIELPASDCEAPDGLQIGRVQAGVIGLFKRGKVGADGGNRRVGGGAMCLDDREVPVAGHNTDMLGDLTAGPEARRERELIDAIAVDEGRSRYARRGGIAERGGDLAARANGRAQHRSFRAGEPETATAKATPAI